jgi:CRISPR-associated protein Cas2
MPRPPKKEYTILQKLALLKKAGLSIALSKAEIEPALPEVADMAPLGSLPERIKQMLEIIQSSPIKATDMLSLIMYDIEDNKVRTLIAKYLTEKGCIRIQKSVYMLRAEVKLYREITETLKEVQQCYDNKDSILLVPIPVNTPGSIQIIGKDIQIDTLVNKPNVLFF